MGNYLKLVNFRNVGQNQFNILPHQGLKTIIELKAHNNPELKEFPKAEVCYHLQFYYSIFLTSDTQSFPHIRVVRPSYAYHCCLFMPSTYEHIVPEYADFGDLSEDVLFPGEFDLSEFGNKSMPNVIWSNSGKTIPITLTIISSRGKYRCGQMAHRPIYQIMSDNSIISLQLQSPLLL